MDIYTMENTDPKATHNELGLTVYFDTSIPLAEAETQMSLLLEGVDAEFSFDMWVTAQKETDE
tara:strand:+ start:7473 stop:7661 length:189 start_codon:yes stop_codon:yes gene_type:complete